METIKINNNISLHYIEMTKLKTTDVGIYIRRGLSEDDASKNALLPYVLKSGCKPYPTNLEIAKKLKDLYGATLDSGVIKNGNSQVIFINSETISDKFAPEGENLSQELMDLLMSIIFKPLTENGAFSKEFVEREKTTVKNKIKALINDKRSYAATRCTQEICKNDVFAISKYGSEESVDRIDEKLLYEHYKKIITSSQVDIFVCGDADIKKLSDKIKEYTNNLEFSEFEAVENTVIKASDKKDVCERMDVTQGKLSIGFTTEICAKDNEYPALVIANSIYGAGTHSKLFNNVREKLSLAYYASSQLNKYKGIIIVNAGIEFKNFQKAYDESILQLEEIKKGNISDDEIAFSKSTIINNLDTYYDDQRYMQLYVLDCLYLGINPDLEAYKEKINAVTKEDVINVIKNASENTVYFLTGKSEN